MEKEKLRIDKYLWCIRIFKTRSAAAEACQKGKVKSNGVSVKPSKIVFISENYEVKTDTKKWVIEITALLYNRVDYQTSLQYYIDLTPEEKKLETQSSAFVFYTGKRKSKKGRPTKKDKRKLDDLLE